jgi:alcohol dehydrogenase class IV
MMGSFSISRLPQILFGEETLLKVPGLAASFGPRALLVTGVRSLENSPVWPVLLDAMRSTGVEWERVKVEHEPSPQLVDGAVQTFRSASISVVIGVGGGSALDTAKAVAGLLLHGNPVMDHLEGVGPEIPYRGPSLPCIAVPTTAGTGTEATKNSVLSVSGFDGFKKSFRHELLVPQYAVVDPELLSSCPPSLIAADGMDALTQLLEAFVSLRANSVTDALALSGLAAVRQGLLAWHAGGAEAVEARRNMAYAALLSGITLAQAGLGAVHGLASPLGAFFPIPHGVVCGTLAAATTAVNIRALRARAHRTPVLQKYAQAGRVLCGLESLSVEEALEKLVETLSEWTSRLQLPGLRRFGVNESNVDRVVAHCRGGSMKSNPLVLLDEEIKEILLSRL